MADVLDHVAFGRQVRGATAELQQDLGVGSAVIPFELFRAGGAHPAADASTVTSSGDRQMQEPTVPQVFPSPLSMMFGVDRRTVGVGTTAVPAVTAPTAGPVATTAIGTAVADDTVTIEGHVLAPQRLQVSAVMGRDELATFAGLADDVEMVLTEALASGLDRQVLYGLTESGGADGAGLLNHGAAPKAPGAVATYATMVKDVLDVVDGRYAAGAGDLAALLGPTTYAFGLALYRGDHDNESAVEKLDRLTSGVMTTAHVADPTDPGDVQQAVVCRGGRRHTGVAQRIWGGGAEIILDPYTRSADGQIRLTAVLMTAGAVIRPAMYERLAFDLA